VWEVGREERRVGEDDVVDDDIDAGVADGTVTRGVASAAADAFGGRLVLDRLCTTGSGDRDAAGVLEVGDNIGPIIAPVNQSIQIRVKADEIIISHECKKTIF
jgi:hypothetical protein